MCIHIYTYIYIYLYAYIHIYHLYIPTYIYIDKNLEIFLSLYTNICGHEYMCACHMCIYVCFCVVPAGTLWWVVTAPFKLKVQPSGPPKWTCKFALARGLPLEGHRPCGPTFGGRFMPADWPGPNGLTAGCWRRRGSWTPRMRRH